MRPLIAICLFVSTLLWAETLEFKKLGKPVSKLSLAELTKQIAPEVLTYEESQENKTRRYKALSFRKILDSIYGTKLTDIDEVLFTCQDGYQPSVPIANFLERTAYLVFGADDGKPFEFKNTKTGERVPYGPYYLIWEPRDKTPGVHESRPYQVVGIDLIRFKDRFPELAPPEKVGTAAKRGFDLYRQHCMQCHMLNGVGGGKAPELNYPMNVTEYFKDSVLVQWILDPTSVRQNAQMFALAPTLPNRAQAARDLISYLRAMGRKKIAPAAKAQ